MEGLTVVERKSHKNTDESEHWEVLFEGSPVDRYEESINLSPLPVEP